jgi:hypothetical protein
MHLSPLAVQDTLHNLHPCSIETQSYFSHFPLIVLLEIDLETSHREHIIRAFALLTGLPKPRALKGALGFGGRGLGGDGGHRLRDLGRQAGHHFLTQMIGPLFPTRFFLNGHVLSFS